MVVVVIICHAPPTRQKLLHLDEQPLINFLLSAHSFLVLAHCWRSLPNSSTYPSTQLSCSVAHGKACFDFFQRGRCSNLQCQFEHRKELLSSKGQLRVWGWVQVRFRRGRRGRTTGNWGADQETKSAERTASASESIIPPGPPPLPAPAIPQGKCGRRKRRHEQPPAPSAPAPQRPHYTC